MIWVATCLHDTRARAENSNPSRTTSSENGVRVEILEGAPDQTNWDFAPPDLSETYGEPAFGFDALPTKYSDYGIKVDRAAPFVFRAMSRITLPKGEHRLLLRCRGAARLKLDGKLIAATKFAKLNADGHEEVPDLPVVAEPELRYPQPGHFECLTNVVFDGQAHDFTLEAVIGGKGRRPELGELTVSVALAGQGTFHLLNPSLNTATASRKSRPTGLVPYTEQGWTAYAADRRAHWKAQDKPRRATAAFEEKKYWAWRHELARKQVADPQLRCALPPAVPTATPVHNDIDRFIGARLATAGVITAPLLDDYAFLRRVTLDTIGTIPTPAQIESFLRDSSKDRRAKAITRLLAAPGWADHWVSYWQDVLAENPGILKPMLNNTGPFRWWLHEAFSDNLPMDRFATELIQMEGSVYHGGPAGFDMATDNDVPMAQKAQIIAQAFLGMQMQCARCHDAPYHDFKQKDLFSVAAMLKKEPQAVPLSSSIPTNANIVVGRVVNVTLKPGSKVEPEWPFQAVMRDDLPPGVLRRSADSREKLAALITDARNERFAKVLVNRVWKRYLGWGIVEPVDDWETAKPSHPELLDWLARELITHDYDLKHIAALILNSHTYQRAVRPDGSLDRKAEERLFASPARRRLTAEQVVDSLFAAAGKPFDSEEMNMDVDGRRPVKDFNNLGQPGHAWEFASLSNERDRPALAMPKAQQIADTLTTFGWRESRQSPLTARDHSANVLQPAALANGLLGNGRITRLSDDHAVTALALVKRPLPELVRAVFLRVLSRPPTDAEAKLFATHLEKGYATRLVEASASNGFKHVKARRAVSWSNHLNPEATTIKQELEREARLGDPPAERLRPDWRERMEDMLWALINSPEFVFLP